MQQPPTNFALVCPGVYRSGFPGRHNIAFLKSLRLRTLVRLAEGDHPPEVSEWIANERIDALTFSMPSNREPFVTMHIDTLLAALSAVLRRENHPVLVHCLHGQRQTGVLVGCVRKLQRWSLAATLDEYGRYAAANASLLDQQMIELMDLRALQNSAKDSEEAEPSQTQTVTKSNAGCSSNR
mmetsp:Transcript_41411/g.88330  ORF Transcript_41411/g.88330 Transcript_41411/m.88330 type:complete len:182 (-) Transcript_41411:202-747(-)